MQGQGSPWPLTFSFGRGPGEQDLLAWAGSDDRWDAGQGALAERVAANAAAVRGAG